MALAVMSALLGTDLFAQTGETVEASVATPTGSNPSRQVLGGDRLHEPVQEGGRSIGVDSEGVGEDWARYVDPFIGTGGHGHTYPGATLPFGMVQLSPDTRLEGWDGCSGYHDSDGVIYGFSHTHLSGTGISDYGDILFMPMTGTPRLANGAATGPDAGYASRFEKSSERAEPGWYAVELADYGISVELTATERAGLHRYRLPENRYAYMIIDLTHRDRVLESSLRIVGDREIEGFRRSSRWAKDQVVYFVARFSRPFTGAYLTDGDMLPGPKLGPEGNLPPDLEEVFQRSESVEVGPDGLNTSGPAQGDLYGESVKALLSLGDSGGDLLVKVGISAVDIQGARRNLDAELPGWDFDEVRHQARQAWNEALDSIRVEGGTEAQRTNFYAALYHSLLAPNLYSDVDGRYRGMDGQVHRATNRRQYTVFSLWDTFRATHPLLTLIEPERVGEFIQTFLAQFEQGGRLPVWELAANETDTMIGYHSVSVIADAWLKGIRGFDEGKALAAMIHSAEQDHFGLDAYKRQGFIGSDDASESVSRTLEYAYDDWCIARMADEMGREETADEFFRRSQGWRHLLDPETGFMRPRRNQRWLEPFDPRRVDNNYTEANAWQYSFFVPHDLTGLMDALGGEEAFIERLDALFSANRATTGREQADITGLIGQYAHGNEPSHHMAWLYHYAGRPDLSGRRVREILDTLYTPAPNGLSGNEDCGQMSSWYVLGAIGLYQVCPCSDEYVLGKPLFDGVSVRLDGGERFNIVQKNPGRRFTEIVAATYNDRFLQRSFLRHGEIAGGGDLILTVGAERNSRWGTASEDRPRTAGAGRRVLAAPFVRSQGDRFRDELQVELVSADDLAEIRYTLDPARPEGEWQIYGEPIILRESSKVRFAGQRDGLMSPVVEATFYRIPHDRTIQVSSVPNPQYTAGGPEALIDGVRGREDWRTGDWQGYQHTDFQATVDLGEPRSLERVGAGFLQDVRSWIWMPAEVMISVSGDGSDFREVARLTSSIPDDQDEVVIRDLVADLGGVEARYLRISARNYGTIPDWHPGHGDGAFIFIDEILVESP